MLSSNPQPKKLKQKMSQDTECTLSQSSDSKIKINIKLPEKLQKLVEEGKSNKPQSIIQIPLEESMLRSSNGRDQNLITVPHLSIRKSNDELFATKNFQLSISQINMSSQRIADSTTVVENNARDMKNSSILIRLQSEQNQQKQVAQKNYNKNKLSRRKIQQLKAGTPQFYQQVELNKQQNIGVPYVNKKSNHSSHTDLYRKAFNSPQIRNEKDQINIKSDKILQFSKKQVGDVKKQVRQQRKQEMKVKRDPRPIKDLEVVRREEKGLIKQEKRLKLKDYLYQVQKSSKRVGQLKHLKDNKNNQEYLKNVQSQIMMKERVAANALVNGYKYQLPNREMVKIMQQQINSDLQETIDTIQKLQNELSEIINFEEEPTNEEMLILYGFRRNIKQEVNKKLKNALESLLRDKLTIIESKKCLSPLLKKQPIFKNI